ncbi:MAG: PAS domain S-box protein [Deltaproteobacteria bacterium]|nr:PAS domain S-box protein [Deltaproteobacteria bacterium]
MTHQSKSAPSCRDTSLDVSVPSPLRLALLAALAACVLEGFIMRLNPLVPEGEPWPLTVLNALGLGVLLGPSLYYVLFRPLRRTLEVCRETLKAARRPAASVGKAEPLPDELEELLRTRPFASPLRLTFFTVSAAFVAETVVTRSIPSLKAVHPLPVAMMDSASLVAFLGPILYLLLFRPLSRAVLACQRALELFRDAKHASDQALRDRSIELAATNDRLIGEIEVRRRTEDALRHSEELHRSLLETMNEGFCVVDGSGIVSYVNQKLLEMLGYSKEEVIGASPLHFLTEEGKKLFHEQAARRRRGERKAYEISWTAKDGHSVPTLVSPRAVFDSAGNFGGSFAVITDVSELKAKEEKLLEWRSHLQLLSAKLMAAQEGERARIARELHDGLGQTLTAIKFVLEGAVARATEEGSEVQKPMELAVQRLKEAVEEVRRIGMALRPSTLDDLGIVATIKWFCREFRVTRPEITVTEEVSVREEEVPEGLKIVIFRVLQEAVNNAAKHSRCKTISVRLSRGERTIELEVADDGVGFDVQRMLGIRTQERRLGLDSMRERALLSGGEFQVDSGEGGTVVRATWGEKALELTAPPTSADDAS